MARTRFVPTGRTSAPPDRPRSVLTGQNRLPTAPPVKASFRPSNLRPAWSIAQRHSLKHKMPLVRLERFAEPQSRSIQPPPIFTNRRSMRTHRPSSTHNKTPILRRSRRTTSIHQGVGDAAPTTNRSSLNRSILVIASFQPNDQPSIRPRSGPNLKTPAASQPNASIHTHHEFTRLVQDELFQALIRSRLSTFKQPLNERRSVLETPPSR